jgi:hypothetical protein
MKIDLPIYSYLLSEKSVLENIEFDSSVQKENIFDYKFIAEVSLEYYKVQNNDQVLLIAGDIYDPDNPKLDNYDIFKTVVAKMDFEYALEKLYSYFGKFIIFSFTKNEVKVMSDVTNMLSIFYHSNKLILSSYPRVISDVLGNKYSLEKVTNVLKREFIKKHYQKTQWWCGNATAFENINALLPNQYLQIKSKEITIFRKFITKTICDTNKTEYCYERSIALLEGFLKSVNERGQFGLTVTGGKDSRILFAASIKLRLENAVYFVIEPNGIEIEDSRIAKELCRSANVDLTVLNSNDDADFINKIKSNCPENEFNDSCPEKDLGISTIITGLIPEIISGYYNNRIFKINGKNLARLAGQFNCKFAETEYDKWVSEVSKSQLPKGYTKLDLFYWEFRAGRCYAQFFNNEMQGCNGIHGFDSREFYDMWLQTNIKHRQYPIRKNFVKLSNKIVDFSFITYDTGSIFKRILYWIQATPLIGRIFRTIYYNYHELK